MRKVLIVGASVRAAAQAARRAGLRPIGFDLFADRDLTQLGPAHRLPNEHPHAAFENLAQTAVNADLPWIYAGAWENQPDRVDRIARRRTLWGNFGPPLRLARDPFAWTLAFQNEGIACAELARDPTAPPHNENWLVKPLASAGGRGIASFSPNDSQRHNVFYQRRIEGPSLSALYLSDVSGSELIGVTRQLIGLPEAPFAYRGSVGPWPIGRGVRETLETIGRVLADRLGLRGLVGVDFILSETGPIPVEINPRHTASTEVLELALTRPLLADHRRVFEPNADPPIRPKLEKPRFVGKSIVFAENDGRFPAGFGDGLEIDKILKFDVPPIADLPEPGSTFERGRPVLSVLVEANDLDECVARLRQSVRDWRERLRRASLA